MTSFDRILLTERIQKAAEDQDQARICEIMLDAARTSTKSELKFLAAEAYNGITATNSMSAVKAKDVFIKSLNAVTTSNSATAAAAAEEFLASLKK